MLEDSFEVLDKSMYAINYIYFVQNYFCFDYGFGFTISKTIKLLIALLVAHWWTCIRLQTTYE